MPMVEVSNGGTAEIPLALGTGSSNVYLSLSWLEYMREARSVYVQTKSSSLSVIARNTSYANAHNFTQGETVQISSLGNIADILVSGTGSLYLRFIM